MRNFIVAAALVLTLSTGFVLGREAATSQPAPAPPAASENGVSVWFSLDGGCADAIVHEIEAAKETVMVQTYVFTSTPIAEAIAATIG